MRRTENNELPTEIARSTSPYVVTKAGSRLNGISSGNTIAVKYVRPIPTKILKNDNTNTCYTIALAINPFDAPIAFMTPNCCVF